MLVVGNNVTSNFATSNVVSTLVVALLTGTNVVHMLKIVKDEVESDHIDKSTSILSKQVVQECNSISCDKSSFQVYIDADITAEHASDTLLKLLAALSKRLNRTLPALLIANIITNVLRNSPTPLQVALGILLRDSKAVISHMYDYRVTCSYDEVLRFKSSAAVAASTNPANQGISDAKDGLIQIVADNFDSDISSPNGKLSTHSMAMIIMQPTRNSDKPQCETIPRLKKNEVPKTLMDEQDYYSQNFIHRKKPSMPALTTSSLSPEILHHQEISRKRAAENDFAFLQDVISIDGCVEFNGYNTKMCREQGHSLAPKTRIVYLPLIDKPPAEPSTVTTVLVKAKQITEAAGQGFTIITLDQQLYRVAVHVMWDNKASFENKHLRLGGMHLLMSYCGCIGTLMADTGIEEILSASFGGVLRMLSGKKFPQNVRALRLLVEELLRPLFRNHDFRQMDDLLQQLEIISLKSKTSQLWIDCLIKPVFVILRYIRAEREADWALHLNSVREMMPLFFAAGHTHYARYALYYLRTMEQLPPEVLKHFTAREHTMHHTPGYFNGIGLICPLKQRI